MYRKPRTRFSSMSLHAIAPSSIRGGQAEACSDDHEGPIILHRGSLGNTFIG